MSMWYGSKLGKNIPISVAGVVTVFLIAACTSAQVLSDDSSMAKAVVESVGDSGSTEQELANRLTPTTTPTPEHVRTLALATPGDIEEESDVSAPEVKLEDAPPSHEENRHSPNLTNSTPSGWDGPLIISSRIGQTYVDGLNLDDDAFVSFSVANLGAATESRFFVDLYFDEYLVQRFQVEKILNPGERVSWTDFAALGELVKLSSGPHILRIVIDPTNLIYETDEADNIYELRLDLTGENETYTDVNESDKGVNLSFYAPDEWGSPLVASSFADEIIIEEPSSTSHRPQVSTLGGQLSRHETTFVAYGITNSGLLSHPGNVLVDIYFDDTLVLRDNWTNFIARQSVLREPWLGLTEVVVIQPGRHTLKVVLDPNDLVVETNESDNVFSRDFEWLDEPVDFLEGPANFAVGLDVPEILELPNLVPGWLWEWDGPIIVNSVRDSTKDGVMTVGVPAIFTLVVFNQSIVAADQDFVVDLFFDGLRVHRIVLRGRTPATSFRILQNLGDVLRGITVSPGPHVIKMVIDPDNNVSEADETDNVFEKRVFWTDSQNREPNPGGYSKAELMDIFQDLHRLMDGTSPVTSDSTAEHADIVINSADAGFFLITGSSFRDERINVQILSREEYLQWIDDSYAERFAVGDGSSYDALAQGRDNAKNFSLAKKQRRFGRIDIAVDGSHAFAEVLNSLVHELGHAWQDRLNPKQTEAGDFLELAAIREAEAQQFERIFWLTVEEFTGNAYTRYPDQDGYHAFIDASVNKDLSSLLESAHSLGRMVQWLTALNDPDMGRVRSELLERGSLSRELGLELYMHLVSLEPDLAGDYVANLMSLLTYGLPKIVEISKSRLEVLASTQQEGSPYLREASLLSP